ncbi:UvrD-helicase domain-containing protein [Phycicoccus sp. MAQZ13P-2]|uniref:UvrD-helicase domain-containing protein n=1 Tax=Phycicoccus mangrovi TaxID=2840470 RepID=UPI001C008467|nr:UvrD-helicase domain-containing protein [Phycicoccus mangrovi]MBT9275374.1 UvrD-helicase domain-containing protein [Phycicoccus mangrovi]
MFDAARSIVVDLVRRRPWGSSRLARTIDDAEESLSALRGWKRTVTMGLEEALAGGRWVSRDVRETWSQSAPLPSRHVTSLARNKKAGQEARELIAFTSGDLRALVHDTNERIRAQELVARRHFLNTIETQPLTDEQAAAVVTFDNRVQVIAAAGSGKTSVMVARAGYAIQRQLVPAERILMLAFNRDAAAELQCRVEERLEAAGIEAPGLTVATFHSFALSVIGSATGRKPRLARWLDAGGDIAMVCRLVDELRDQSPAFRDRWDAYRLLFARMSDDPSGGEPDSYDHSTRQTGYRTFKGETVRSQGERMIADFLFLNGVRYEYEAPYQHDVADADHSQYRPDFYYPDVDVYHEHWALDREGNPPPHFVGYTDSMQWKKAVHQQFGTTLLETTWASIIDQTGFGPLADDLTKAGLALDWNPDRPVPGATPVKHEDLARVMRSFMTHVKSNSLSRADLERRLEAAPRSVQRFRARMFLDLFWDIHNAWQARLAADDCIDFEDMLVQAATHLESGGIDMGYELVLVDEFQDASQARARLTKALVDQPHRYLLAVGDDWQSINRFAGADLSVMTSFAEWFGEGQTLRLQTTFRSPQSICDVASEFVAKNPRQLTKVVTSAHLGYGQAASLVRVRRFDEVSGAVARVLDDLAARVRTGEVTPGRSGMVEVDVLGRYRFDRDSLPRRTPPELKVTFRTVHGSKGLEADYVILPNVASGTYGFPSEVADDPVMSLAMAETDAYPFAEERRLFYVALTRARRHVTMIGVEGRESAFVAELLATKRLELSPLSTVDLSAPCPLCDQGVLVVRRRKADGRPFEGCSAFPRCRFTRSALSAASPMRLAASPGARRPN